MYAFLQQGNAFDLHRKQLLVLRAPRFAHSVEILPPESSSFRQHLVYFEKNISNLLQIVSSSLGRFRCADLPIFVSVIV